MVEYRLTTKDNPYNPFTQFGEWIIFDKENGYDSCEFMARLSGDIDSMSEEEQIEESNRVIDEIIEKDPFGIYTKVSA